MGYEKMLLEIVLRTAIIYTIVLVGLRLMGKRPVGQMTPFDLVLLLLLANAVQNAMTGPDTSVGGGIVAAATLLLANSIVARAASRSERIRRWVEGTPTLLIRDGHILTQNMMRERITREDLLHALREHGVGGIEEVAVAVLEVDGSISVLTQEEWPAPTRPHHRIRFLSRAS